MQPKSCSTDQCELTVGEFNFQNTVAQQEENPSSTSNVWMRKSIQVFFQFSWLAGWMKKVIHVWPALDCVFSKVGLGLLSASGLGFPYIVQSQFMGSPPPTQHLLIEKTEGTTRKVVKQCLHQIRCSCFLGTVSQLYSMNGGICWFFFHQPEGWRKKSECMGSLNMSLFYYSSGSFLSKGRGGYQEFQLPTLCLHGAEESICCSLVSWCMPGSGTWSAHVSACSLQQEVEKKEED